MYRVALDILPTQASAVCCERLFSSSKETVTKRRNKLAPALVEAIQHLKFVFRGDRNSFIEANATESEMATHTMLEELSATPLAAEDLKDLMEKGDDIGLDAALAKIELFEAWDALNHGVQRDSEMTGSTEDQ